MSRSICLSIYSMYMYASIIYTMTCIKNLVKHLWWSFFVKIIISYKLLGIFVKKSFIEDVWQVLNTYLIYHVTVHKVYAVCTESNTENSPNLLVWTFCGNTIRLKLWGNCAFPQNSTPGKEIRWNCGILCSVVRKMIS